MMITYRFVRLIEDRSDALASGLLHKVQQSPRTEAFRSKVPPDELKQRVHEIYLHLGDWLLHKSERDVEQRYMQIGARRAEQGVPLSQLIWAIILTKENLWEFVLDESYADRPVEVFGKQELLRLLERFFDWAIYAATIGYERALETMTDEEKQERIAV